jgi:hypothetical protein
MSNDDSKLMRPTHPTPLWDSIQRQEAKSSKEQVRQPEIFADVAEVRRLAAHYGGYCEKILRQAADEIERRRRASETQAPLCIDCLELKNALAAAVGVANEAREQHDRDNDMRVMKLLLALAGDVKGYRADTDRIHDVLRRATERFSVKANGDVP